MTSDEKEVPASTDYAKSNEVKGSRIPQVLTQKMGVVVGLGAVVIIAALAWTVGHFSHSPGATNPLKSHSGFKALQGHVESLAEVDGLCLNGESTVDPVNATAERATCLCEFADRLRDEHRVPEIRRNKSQ